MNRNLQQHLAELTTFKHTTAGIFKDANLYVSNPELFPQTSVKDASHIMSLFTGAMLEARAMTSAMLTTAANQVDNKDDKEDRGELDVALDAMLNEANLLVDELQKLKSSIELLRAE